VDDPLSQALADAPQRHDERRDDVSHHHTPHAPALGTVLTRLREQLVDALNLPFFDGGTAVETTPVTKHALAEMGAETVLARKREPAYEARVTIEVRCDHDEDARGIADAGAYHVRARARLQCDDPRGRTERSVAVDVDEVDGHLCLDVAALREAMAGAIRSIGTMP
jgi:hypothetical protein